MRPWSAIRLIRAAGHAAAALALMVPSFSRAEALKPTEALDRYLAEHRDELPPCSNSLFTVQIDASMPAVKRHGSMTGFKRIVPPGKAVYRSLRFTGDMLVKTQVIARYLAHETNPPAKDEDTGVTLQNYVFSFDKAQDYNGRLAYVFQMKPRRKRIGLFRGELWLDAETAEPHRIWGDFVKSPSIFVRSFRFVQDYQTVAACTEPLRLLLTARTRIAGTVEMTVWLHPAPEEPEETGGTNAIPGSSTLRQAGSSEQ